MLPDAAYTLRLATNYARLQSIGGESVPKFADEANDSVRVYTKGEGQVVMLAENYFNNYRLNHYDHAELLLGLAQLNRKTRRVTGFAKHFVFVQHVDMPKWYLALWQNFQPGLIGLACALLMLLWSAVRRFGPILPEPDLERRSLIEHIDASGRWLWKVPGGREILLGAARACANRTLQRRAPQLHKLPIDEQIISLAESCNLASGDVVAALRNPAAKSPIEFTRQIQTLRELRKSHER
jgi:hypothetical protein